MFWGFVFTMTALGVLIFWALLQIKRVDSVIEQADQKPVNDEGTAKK